MPYRQEETRGVIGTLLWFLYRGMRRDIRGFLAIILMLAAFWMAIVGIYLWGVIALAFGFSLLVANGSSEQ